MSTAPLTEHEDQAEAAPVPPPPTADHFDTPLFNRLLGLIENLNTTMDEQKRAIQHQATKLDALVDDALKDDQPYNTEKDPEKAVKNEQMWSGVYEIATAKMKEEADEWKGLMDVSLVFIAIFLAVLTAFLVPAAQSLSPNSTGAPNNATSPPPPLPPHSDENVCALYYLALIMAMCNAVLCVLGRQWVGKLLSRPVGNSHLERTMRHEERKRLAYGWIRPLVAILYWSLLLSIGLFIAGLLYQLRNLSTSFEETAMTLQATWGLGIVLVAGIIATITATTVHAVRFECSPFEGLFSKFIVKVMALLAQRISWFTAWRRSFHWDSSKLFQTYVGLIAEAHDPKLLDRAVPSFTYSAWLAHGGKSVSLLRRAYDRLMATDTSVRVRESVKAQISHFAEYCRENSWDDTVKETLVGNTLIQEFLISNCSFPTDFVACTTFLALKENNEDLHDLEELSYKGGIARILCTYDQDVPLGDREVLFLHAVEAFERFETDDVKETLSGVEPLSVIRSFMRGPNTYIPFWFITDIIPRCDQEIISCINDSLRNPPSNINRYVVISIIYVLAATRKVSLPLDVDLSPFIECICQQSVPSFWVAIRDYILDYAEALDLASSFMPVAMLEFLQLCAQETDEEPLESDTPDARANARTRAKAILERHLPSVIPLPPSPQSSRASFIDILESDDNKLSPPVDHPRRYRTLMTMAHQAFFERNETPPKRTSR
ncbi:hypothetical protein SISNIDRAFT_542246 [Sistotremastrum niveocremeum HHB9708]|uniref:DUF6535 domain-containing protein n=1 Tax=Sistotremastrum niveocremeum HHB9708 TaxID=1314777 RepID=A0A164X0C7_9AGAM|nr:hypothetical protein SISNIDRAFT_542246 [Sistotremastrum niveocremeum HHB9708]